MMAPPTLCTPAMMRRICESIAIGNFPEIACEAAGLDPRRYYDWMAKGRAGTEPFATFEQAIKKALAEGEEFHVKRIAEGPKTWASSAWILERGFHKQRWAKPADLPELTPNQRPFADLPPHARRIRLEAVRKRIDDEIKLLPEKAEEE